MNIDINISNIDGDEGELVRAHLGRTHSRFNGYTLPDELKEYLDSLLGMKVTDDDIWLCSYPKTGTTWAREMVYRVAKDVDLVEAQTPLEDRFPFVDKCFLSPKNMSSQFESDISQVKRLLSSSERNELESPRFIHTHMPFELLPRQLTDGSTNAKIVYIVRNPRDACISAFHQKVNTRNSRCDLNSFSEIFLKGLVSYGPFWKHVLGYWNKRNDKHVLFIKYEDMKKDLPSVIRQTATFLETPITDKQMGPLCQHLSFESMKNSSSIYEKPLLQVLKKKFNPDGNFQFFREGKSEQWKKKFQPELIERFHQWEHENLEPFNVTSYDDL